MSLTRLKPLNDVEIGKRLRFQRAMLGLVQADMARALGVAPHTVNHVEQGRRPVTWDLCRRYVAVTGCTFEELFN